MTQEDKELLLKDLCARLPYGVKVKIPSIESPLTVLSINTNGVTWVTRDTGYPFEIDWENCKPYLFPLSSMTEEQKRELCQMDAFVSIFGDICFSTYDDYGHELMPTYEDAIRITNWLLKNHFDIYGLIPKGIALDATILNVY